MGEGREKDKMREVFTNLFIITAFFFVFLQAPVRHALFVYISVTAAV